MAIYGYTKNYKLIKPQYDSDTWHDYEYDNLDTIDAVLSAIYASGNWKGFWVTNTAYVVGDVVIDQDTDTMYKVMFDHTTSEATFAAEQTAHPDYYELWSPNNLAESWAIKTDSKVSNEDYSAKAYAISSGLIDDGSAKEWAIGFAAIGNTNEYSAKKYATDAHNDYISMTTNPNVVAISSNIANVSAVGQSISNVNTVASNVSSVNTVAGISTDVTTVVGISTDVSTVANNSANVTTVATNISDVNTVAFNMTAIQAATTSATNAANSATDSANYATASANSANNSHIWAEGTDEQIQALGGVHSSKGWAEQSTNANVSLSNLDATGQAKFDAKVNTDASNFTSAGKETVVGWGMPDYSAGMAKNRNTPYTAEIDGLLFVCFNMYQTPADANYMTINNVVIHGKQLGGNSGGGYFSVYPLSKNDNWIFSTSSSQGEIMFYPLKGVN